MSELTYQYRSAAAFFATVASEFDRSTQLKFYGLYKQISEGPIQRSPWLLMFSTDLKAKAWSACRDLTKEEAMQKYVDATEGLGLSWTKETAKDHGTMDGGLGLRPSMPKVEDTGPTTSSDRFYDAVRAGNISEVEKYLKENPDVAEHNKDGTPIHWAADANQPAMIEFLVKHGCSVVDVDDEDQTPLHVAAICDHVEAITKLLELGADLDATDADGTAARDLIEQKVLLEYYGTE
uniref:Acyl-CoA-binding domain-containing protein 6 n=1 Tax=Panagrellus redivivus TaxID=6233 RepID=A0A7E4UWG2_PANRE